MRLPRRKLLLASVAAPALLRTRFAKAFLPHGGGGTAVGGDPLAAILSQMGSGQWKQLDGPNSGNFVGQLLARTQANFDPGGLAAAYTGYSTPVTFAANASGLDYDGAPRIVHNWSFGTSAIRQSDGLVVHAGNGGHVATGDNGVYQFDVKAACAALMAAGGVGATPTQNWTTIKKAGTQLLQCYQRPSWSLQSGYGPNQPSNIEVAAFSTTGDTTTGSNQITNVASITGSGFNMFQAGYQVGGPNIPPFQTVSSVSGTGPWTVTFGPGTATGNQTGGFVGTCFGRAWWADYNIDGQKCLGAFHTYWYTAFDPVTGKTIWSGEASYPATAMTNNQYEVIDPSQSAPNNSLIVNGGFGTPGCFDIDGKFYTWIYNTPLQIITGACTASPSSTAVGWTGQASNGPGPIPGSVHVQGIAIPDPVNGPPHRALWSQNTSPNPNTAVMLKDITGSPALAQWNMGSPPFDPDSGDAFGFSSCCYDTLRNRIVGMRTKSTRYLQYVTINGSNLAASTWTVDSTVSGDIPSDNPTDPTHPTTPRIEYLPTYDCFIMEMYAHVYVRKP